MEVKIEQNFKICVLRTARKKGEKYLWPKNKEGHSHAGGSLGDGRQVQEEAGDLGANAHTGASGEKGDDRETPPLQPRRKAHLSLGL